MRFPDSLTFPSRKSKNAVFDFLHFQSLIVIENAGPSLVRSGSALNQMAFPYELWPLKMLTHICAGTGVPVFPDVHQPGSQDERHPAHAKRGRKPRLTMEEYQFNEKCS
jgi:hypothetical protein